MMHTPEHNFAKDSTRRDVPLEFPLNTPWIDRPDLEALIQSSNLQETDAERLRRFAADGVVVVDSGASDQLIDEVLACLSREHPALIDGTAGRVLDAWQSCGKVRELAVLPEVLRTLEILYRRPPIPFQTLNFEVGTQQRLHADSIHFQSYPQNWMAGVWIALEDIDPDSGPLQYVPGSHRIPPLLDPTTLGVLSSFDESYRRYEDYVEYLVEAHGMEPMTLELKKGQAVIWSANVLHGGTPIRRAGSTRRSQVTHYYFPGATYYTPMFSDVFAGEIHFRTTELVDIRTGKPIEHRYKGNRFDPQPHSGKRVIPADRGGGVQAPSRSVRLRRLADDWLPPRLTRALRTRLRARR